MVEYHEWVGIVFDVAGSKGYEASFDGNQEVTSLAAEIWNDRKTELKGFSTRQAREAAQNEVQV